MEYVRNMISPMLRISGVRRLFQASSAGLSRSIFMISIAVLGFMCGSISTVNHWFPYNVFENAAKTLATIRVQFSPPSIAPYQFIDFSGGNIGDVEHNRIVVRAPAPAAASGEHFLMSGGIYQYLDYCPLHSCIAAEFTRQGMLVHAYPYRPNQYKAHAIASLPYEQVNYRFPKNEYPWGFLKLPGGDLIVVFHTWNVFPFGGGIARIRPNGSVVWFRRDYSNHWPRLIADNQIAVPAMRIGGSTISVGLTHDINFDLQCDGKIQEDIVRIINLDGNVLKEISVLDALLHSPYTALLVGRNPCDPIHLNYIVPVTKGIASLYHDVSADDFVVSLREINAFAILGRLDGRLKHLFTGTFLRQHSVQPLGQSAKMLIFDNHGADWQWGPSRFLSYNLVDHLEQTLLPNAETAGLGLFSHLGGNISVSPDLSRAIVASSEAGRAYEVNISDGKVLTEFNNVHDLRKVPAAGEESERAAGRFDLYTVEYVH